MSWWGSRHYDKYLQTYGSGQQDFHNKQVWGHCWSNWGMGSKRKSQNGNRFIPPDSNMRLSASQSGVSDHSAALTEDGLCLKSYRIMSYTYINFNSCEYLTDYRKLCIQSNRCIEIKIILNKGGGLYWCVQALNAIRCYWFSNYKPKFNGIRLAWLRKFPKMNRCLRKRSMKEGEAQQRKKSMENLIVTDWRLQPKSHIGKLVCY